LLRDLLEESGKAESIRCYGPKQSGCTSR